MQKRLSIFFLAGLLLFVAACQTPPPTTAPPAATEPEAYATAPQGSAPTAPSLDLGQTTDIPGCTVISQDSSSNVEDSPFAAIKDNDWVMGSEDAQVTIIEYSDFQ